MSYSPTIFNQLLAMIPRERFQSIVTQYRGDYRVHTFPCWSQLVVMIYAQLTDKESLRDLETALSSKKNLTTISGSLKRRARRLRTLTPDASGKSIRTCFMNS